MMVINNVIYIGYVELLCAWQSHEKDTRKEVIQYGPQQDYKVFAIYKIGE